MRTGTCLKSTTIIRTCRRVLRVTACSCLGSAGVGDAVEYQDGRCVGLNKQALWTMNTVDASSSIVFGGGVTARDVEADCMRRVVK